MGTNIVAALHWIMKVNLWVLNVFSIVDRVEGALLSNASECLRQASPNVESGIGVERKRAEVITSDMEKQLRLKGIMGYV